MRSRTYEVVSPILITDLLECNVNPLQTQRSFICIESYSILGVFSSLVDSGDSMKRDTSCAEFHNKLCYSERYAMNKKLNN